jgi:hypothetical protein
MQAFFHIFSRGSEKEKIATTEPKSPNRGFELKGFWVHLFDMDSFQWVFLNVLAV